MKRDVGGFFQFCVWGNNLPETFNSTELHGTTTPFETLGIENIVIEDEASSSAYHVPEGMFLLYDPKNPRANEGRADGREDVSTLDIAPFFLDYFGVEVPDYMNAPGAIGLDA